MDRRKHLLVSFLNVALLMGCAGPQKPPPPPPVESQPQPPPPPPQPAAAPAPAPDTGKPVSVSLQVEAITKKGQQEVAPGETLHSGDRMAMRVEVDQPAYVYVAQASADGSSSVLFPAAGDEQLQPGAQKRIPALGQWLQLDKDTGQEDLFVYASRQPIPKDTLQARIKADLGAARAGAASQKAAPVRRKPRHHTQAQDSDAPAPGALTAGSRGLKTVSDADAGAGQQDESGVTSRHFSIQHAR